jgi:hypothetical protein
VLACNLEGKFFLKNLSLEGDFHELVPKYHYTLKPNLQEPICDQIFF